MSASARYIAMPREAGLPTLVTERLVLRGPRAEDFGPYRDFQASERSRFVGGPRTEREAWAGFAARWGHIALNGYGGFTVTVKGSEAGIGFVGPIFLPGWAEPEIGWTLYTGEGQGYAHEAALAVRGHVYRDLGWTTAISYIDTQNERSQSLARRLGCTPDRSVPHPFESDTVAWRHPAPEAA